MIRAMSLSHAQLERVNAFLAASDFHRHGWVITDLDGTAVHGRSGRASLPNSVKDGLSEIYRLGLPVVINTLRSAPSVMKTFGREWQQLARGPIPTVLLNGSLLGYIEPGAGPALSFREIAAFPLSAEEVEATLARLEPVLAFHAREALLFFYPRDWRAGEWVWTALPDREAEVIAKFPGATSVCSGSLNDLRARLLAEPICMLLVHLDLDAVQRRAYQHPRRINFHTSAGVDKLSGARAMAEHLGLNLAQAFGAGDTEMDTFLAAVGLPAYVGHQSLSFRGPQAPIRIPHAAELGEVLRALAAGAKV